MVKNPPANAGDIRHGFNPWTGKIPGGGNSNPLQYSSLENPHGQRSLAGYSPQGGKELDTTEVTQHTHTSMVVLLRVTYYESQDVFST